MSSLQEDLLRQTMEQVTKTLTKDLQDFLKDSIEKHVDKSIDKVFTKTEFYRRVSEDMRNGLKGIYKKINTMSGKDEEAPTMDRSSAQKLFHEASEQLNTVLKQTEQATEEIITIVEKHLDKHFSVVNTLKELLDETDIENNVRVEWLQKYQESLNEDLNGLMLSLSFQDLTGQRIKKAVKALEEIESTVVELYLSSGLLIQAYEEDPGKDIEKLESEAKLTVESLKKEVVNSKLSGPGDGVSQKNIDELMSELGM